MMSLKVVIVGGVAGGASCAARLRRLDENAQIVLLERDDYISFANCGLPYYIGGVIAKRDALLVQTPERMRQRFNIDVRVRHEAIRINRDEHTVEIKNKETGETYFETYDKLLLSPGATPVRPGIPGIDNPRVFTLRNIADVDAIKKTIDESASKHAVVVGAGFIGIEMAENLHRRGMSVTLVELADHILPSFDFEMAAIAQNHIVSKGIDVIVGDGVASIDHKDDGSIIKLASGTKIDADIIIMSIGVRPAVQLAADAGLEVGVTGGISVDGRLQTSDPDIYAVGDAIEVKNYVTGKPALIPLAGPANKQGRVAADNIAGRDEKYKATIGTAIVKVFDLAVASTGINEMTAKRLNLPYKASVCHPSSHATYYPGADVLSIKTIFDPQNGKVLGAQVVGRDMVDKTIDVFAMAIHAGMTVLDLQELELSYAPPFSSARSPVNVAGFVSSNMLKGDVEAVGWDEIDLQNKEIVLLDVRTPGELKKIGAVEGAVNIPIDQLRSRIDELPKDREINVYCKVGLRAYLATRILKQHGYRVKNISGGYATLDDSLKAKKDEKA